MNSKIQQSASILVILIWLWYILYIGKSLFVSLLFTVFIYILIRSAYSFFYLKFKSKFASIAACIVSIVLFFSIIYLIVSTQIDAFWQDIERYKEVFLWLSEYLQKQLWISLDIRSFASRIDFQSMFQSFSSLASGFLGQVWTIAFLLVFLFIEKNHFISKIKKILTQQEYKKFETISSKIHDDLTLYFGVKFSMASLNATVSFIMMSLFGLEYALFFAFLIFLFDFIPNIWAIIAMSIPFLFSFSVFDSSLTPFLLLWALLIPQTFTWNFLEPRLIGTRLNLSGFFILISLIIFGSLWWIVWAFLAVPLVTSINIILSQFKKTHKIAIMLSEKWDI